MATRRFLSQVKDELGFTTILNASRDVHTLLLAKFIRMFAYGSSTLILAIYFAALGHSDTKIGLFMSLTLAGDVVISLLLTFVADKLGRRKILILGGLLMALSGVVFGIFHNYWILLLAAIVGVISPSGNEIGPFRAVEESTLAHLSEAKTRSDVFAFYVVAGTLGSASGSLFSGFTTQALQTADWTEASSFRFIFWIYALLGLIKAGVSLTLSPACEAPKQDTEHNERGQESEAFLAQQNTPKPPPPSRKSPLAQISKESQKVLAKLCGLFFFDSLASGMVPNSLIAFYMERKFGMARGKLGSVIAVAQFMSSIGNIFASSIAKRIGLVRTMVFTHLPSAIFLALVPAPPSLVFTVMLLVMRASLSSMDQAPRSAFLSAIVLPSERTAVMGVVNTVKTMSQSSGPLITGALAGGGRFWIAFVVAGSMKASYDLGMLSMFASVKLDGDKSNAKTSAAQEEEFALSDLSDDETDQEDSMSEASATKVATRK